MYLLDTNICIYLIKKRPHKVLDRLTACDPRDVAVSVVTVAELANGVKKSQAVERNGAALELFLAPLEVLQFSVEAAMSYGEIRAELEKKGTPIGSLDLLIAAQAIASDATLVSNNLREFKRVPGLRSENWAR